MIREIKYAFSSTVDYFTCHALFSEITDRKLSTLNINFHSKQPEYKVSFQDRVVTILINENDLKIIQDLPISVSFNHKGKPLNGILFSNKQFEKTYSFKEGDFVIATGVISYAKNVSSQNLDNGRKHQSPITPNGNFVEGSRKHTLEYLEKKLGLGLTDKVDTRSFRFEMISYKNFEDRTSVFSKSNQNKISIHNVFSFELQAYVTDAIVANSLESKSIGKKRSYGFGNVNLRKQ